MGQLSPEDTTIAEIDLETEVSIVYIIFEVERRMSQLGMCENRLCEACLEDFCFIDSQNSKYSDSVTRKLLDLEFLEIFQQVLRQYFKNAVREADDMSVSTCMNVIISTCNTVVNMSDISSGACRKSFNSNYT